MRPSCRVELAHMRMELFRTSYILEISWTPSTTARESQIGQLSWPVKEVMRQASFPSGLSREILKASILKLVFTLGYRFLGR